MLSGLLLGDKIEEVRTIATCSRAPGKRHIRDIQRASLMAMALKSCRRHLAFKDDSEAEAAATPRARSRARDLDQRSGRDAPLGQRAFEHLARHRSALADDEILAARASCGTMRLRARPVPECANSTTRSRRSRRIASADPNSGAL